MKPNSYSGFFIAAAVCFAAGLGFIISTFFADSQARAAFEPWQENIKILSLQVGRNTYGIAMVDVVNKRLWVYEVNRDSGAGKLRLLAARNWEYDQMLEDYNTAEPRPDQVRQILERVDDTKKNKQQ